MPWHTSGVQRIVGKNSQKSMLVCILQNPTRSSRASWYFFAYCIWHTMYWDKLILFVCLLYSIVVCDLERSLKRLYPGCVSSLLFVISSLFAWTGSFGDTILRTVPSLLFVHRGARIEEWGARIHESILAHHSSTIVKVSQLDNQVYKLHLHNWSIETM